MEVNEREFEEMKRLAQVAAYRFSRGLQGYVDLDDLKGAAWFGLVKARNTYDPSKGARFSSWAWTEIRYALKEEARSQDYLTRDQRAQYQKDRSLAQYQKPARIDRVLNSDRAEDTYGDLLADPRSHRWADRQVEVVMAKNAMQCLNDRQRQVVSLVLRGYMFREVADMLRISSSRVKQIYDESIDRMRFFAGVPPKQKGVCKTCGAPVGNTGQTCSRVCRAALDRTRDPVKPLDEAKRKVVCVTCGVLFGTDHHARNICSSACYRVKKQVQAQARKGKSRRVEV